MPSGKNSNAFYLKVRDIQSFYFGVVIVFLCTGFFYNFAFLRLFGIRVELFFTLQDYLASSIEKVYLIFIAVLFASGSGHVIRYLLRMEKNNIFQRLFHVGLYVFPLIICTAGVSLITTFDNPFGYYLVSLAIYIGIDYLLFRGILRGDHASYKRFFFITVLLLYLLMLGSTILIDRDVIYKEPLYELKDYRIKFDDKIKVDQGPLVLLEGCSSFDFFYNKKEHKSFIIPRRMIEYFEFRHKVAEGSYYQ